VALEGAGVADGEDGAGLYLGVNHELPDAGDGGGGHAEADEAKYESHGGADAGALAVGLEVVDLLAFHGGRFDVREDWARHCWLCHCWLCLRVFVRAM
jgi:hypothetical protein